MGASADSISSVRDRRQAVGLSQQRLAQLANCSVSMVRLLESGYRPETGRSDVLERIVAVLEATSRRPREDAVSAPERQPIAVVVVGAPTSASDDVVIRWFERWLEGQSPGTTWVARRSPESRAA